ncbi:uncharacterized protein LOC115922841 [Strongylocentrotus purpuratus]|uniref:Reverse transcriptase domain-containing protein n=1 Tax=Strongylocentrotus purpuratus TaxID=7668 RepID=A0A7M7NNW2_STRPU|nr:uncharacterized protein LOC115922841 [Strongylocentrotus purpuratus]
MARQLVLMTYVQNRSNILGTIHRSGYSLSVRQLRNLYQLPKIWRKASAIAILKPWKNNEAKSYRPIFLLCHLFKFFERLMLYRQAGFWPGRSCTGQVLNLTQHIEDGVEKNEPTGVVFVDLKAAYDTVNHRILLDKLDTMTKDSHLTKIIQMLLEIRRLYVEFNGKRI